MEQGVYRLSEHPSIAFVVQRCGSKIYAGAERNAFRMAQALSELGCTVRVYTSQSDSYVTWANNLPAEEVISEKFKILRFPTHYQRRRVLFALLKKVTFFLMKTVRPLYSAFAKQIDLWFLKLQGPWCPELWETLKADENAYDCVVVNSYLYAPTFFSIKNLSLKKLFIVTGHEEIEFYMNFVGDEVARADTLGFLSVAEKNLCEHVWPVSKQKKNIFVPPGIDELAPKSVKPTTQILPDKFFLYLGRVDRHKGIEELYQLVPPHVRVVFAGHIMWPFKPDLRFVMLGAVSEEEKNWLYKNAIGLLVTSRKESYSIVTADAISAGCAVFALKGCGPVDELVERYGGLVMSESDYGKTLSEFWNKPELSKTLALQVELIKTEKSWLGSAKRIYEWAVQ